MMDYGPEAGKNIHLPPNFDYSRDYDAVTNVTTVNTLAMGEGAIDGVATDYEVPTPYCRECFSRRGAGI